MKVWVVTLILVCLIATVSIGGSCCSSKEECQPGDGTDVAAAMMQRTPAETLIFISCDLEAFRQHSYFSDLARGVICGLGAQGYELALQAALHALEQP